MAPAWIRTLIKSFCQQHSPKKAMSHSNSTNSAYSTNNNNAAQYLNDGEIGVTNSDQMFNALMEQYLSQGSSSTSHTPVPELSRDPRTGQTFQRGACPAGGPGQHHTRNSPSWGFSTPPQGYGSFSGPGQTALSTQGPNLASQPCFSDLMREMGHEHSRALHEAALRAPFKPVTPNSSIHNSPHQGLTSSPGDYLYNRPGGLPNSTSQRTLPSRSPSGSVSGSSSGARQATTFAEDDAMFEMFPCDMCTASFSRRHDLERHRRGHSGESPYVCEGCGGGFTRSDGRGRHWKLQPTCEALHFQRGGSGKRRSGPAPGPASH